MEWLEGVIETSGKSCMNVETSFEESWIEIGSNSIFRISCLSLGNGSVIVGISFNELEAQLCGYECKHTGVNLRGEMTKQRKWGHRRS